MKYFNKFSSNLSLSHSLTQSITTHSITELSHAHNPSLTHTHCHTHCHSYPLTHSHPHTPHTHTLTPSLTHSLTPSARTCTSWYHSLHLFSLLCSALLPALLTKEVKAVKEVSQCYIGWRKTRLDFPILDLIWFVDLTSHHWIFKNEFFSTVKNEDSCQSTVDGLLFSKKIYVKLFGILSNSILDMISGEMKWFLAMRVFNWLKYSLYFTFKVAFEMINLRDLIYGTQETTVTQENEEEEAQLAPVR